MGGSVVQGRIPGPYPEGLMVIETMRAEPDGRIMLWFLHLDRLRRDCAAVGFALDETAVAVALEDLPSGRALRVRLTVDGEGRVGLSHADLPATPSAWRVAISDLRLRSGDPWLRIKTSHRPVYDAARRLMPSGQDEAILLNEAGEVCEGTITTIFLRRKDALLTPRLSAGVLPGVLRASLISTGKAREANIRPEDLLGGEVYCGNAVRGLIPVRLSSA